jgi:hypothetical protein
MSVCVCPTRLNGAPFTFVVNLLVPGPPNRCLVMSYAADYDPMQLESPSNAGVASTSGSTLGEESDTEMQSPFDLAFAR